MCGGILAAMIIRILPSTPFAKDRTVVALSLALLAGGFSLVTLWREYKSTREVASTPLTADPAGQSLQLS
jgi:hypothetical protein